jgi:hypothetical protein
MYASNKAVLIVSYLGFQTQEVSVAGKSRVNVSLSEQSNSLNEVVVVGYGSVKKTDLTGAVNTLSAAKITERNTIPILWKPFKGEYCRGSGNLKFRPNR